MCVLVQSSCSAGLLRSHTSHTTLNFASLHLVLSRPDVLEQTLFSGQTAQGVISLRSETDGTGQGEGDGGTGGATFGIDFDKVDLDGSVVLGGD